MNDNELINRISKPKATKPDNSALWLLFAFFNAVTLLIDAVSGYTVYALTGWIPYGVFAFLAGWIPLMLWEAGYVRSASSAFQRKLSMAFAAIAFLSILGIALLSAWANVSGYADRVTAEYATVSIIISVALLHAIGAAFYFYADDGIRAVHREHEIVATHNQRMRWLDLAGREMEAERKAQAISKNIAGQYGINDPKLIERLASILSDSDGNGIPDVFENRQPMKAAASETESPRPTSRE